jgi:2'-5' RNA ligase
MSHVPLDRGPELETGGVRPVNLRPSQDSALGRRLFVAIPVPDPVRASVAAVVDRVRAAADPETRDVRWVRLDGLHLTLRFLGPTDEERIAGVEAAVDRVAGEVAPFEIAISGAGAFPSPARPRALWMAIDTGADHLADVARRLDAALAETGWPSDDRPFRAHLTLARSDGVRAGRDVARRLIAEAADVREVFQATSIALYETMSGGGPARYVALHEKPLGPVWNENVAGPRG